MHEAGTILDSSGNPFPPAASMEASPYEGATTGRLGDWGLNLGGPTSSLYNSIVTLRGRARDSYRNNPLARGGIDSFVSNLVGTDISPRWQVDNDEQREELQELWTDSVSEMDFYGNSDFYGQERTVCRSVIKDGEILGRMVDVPPGFILPSGLPILVPMQVQLLEPDHLDASYNDMSPSGNEIRYAIEWKNNRRHAYWLEREHPGENFLTGKASSRIPVPAEDIVHVFRPERPGQARGASWLAPILVKLREIDLYDDAELVRKKAAALWGGFIYSDAPIGGRNVGGKVIGANGGQQSIKLEPGTFPVLKNGMKVEFSKTADVGNNYRDFLKVQFAMIARGLGITYEQLTGDLEGVTFSSIRAGLIEFRRLCETIQLDIIIFQFCRPVSNRWVRTAILNGVTKTISIKEYRNNPRKFHRIEWQPDGWDYVQPVHDRIAEQMDVRNGFDSRTAIVSRRGRNVERVDKENKADSERAGKHKLVYDSDPGQTTQSGTLQKLQEAVVLGSLDE